MNRWRRAYLDEQSVLGNLRSLESIKCVVASERQFCSQCGVLVTRGELSAHEGHDVVEGVSDSQLEAPTTLLSPVDDRKSQAVRKDILHVVLL